MLRIVVDKSRDASQWIDSDINCIYFVQEMSCKLADVLMTAE